MSESLEEIAKKENNVLNRIARISNILNGMLRNKDYVGAILLADNLESLNKEVVYAGIAAHLQHDLEAGKLIEFKAPETRKIYEEIINYCKRKARDYFKG